MGNSAGKKVQKKKGGRRCQIDQDAMERKKETKLKGSMVGVIVRSARDPGRRGFGGDKKKIWGEGLSSRGTDGGDNGTAGVHVRRRRKAARRLRWDG